MRRKYSGFNLRDALELLGVETFVPWNIAAAPMASTEHLQEDLRRFESFDLETSEAAKLLLLDALFAEIVPRYPNLKVWKSAPLETQALTGIADYVIAPKRAYLATPLLCVAEAKRDDFVQGRAQCLVEIAACVAQNRADGHTPDVYGVVSNGQVWQFYWRETAGTVHESDLFTVSALPKLLAALDFVCAACAQNVP